MTYRFARFFTDDAGDIEWGTRDVKIVGADGSTVFEQRGVEAPVGWSDTAVGVTASKYFRGQLGTLERETSVAQVIYRVASIITDWGVKEGYFADAEEAEIFFAELSHLLLHQYAAFNSPVWFNVGVSGQPQCSACFINEVEDSMESILDLIKTEGMIFKGGSGSGVNLSRLRGKDEKLTGGGTASGPVSFMRGFDAFAGVIKSGGKTRRAAKIVILNDDHPDLVEFIACKQREEKKARDLISLGYDADLDGEAYASVFFQNANHSVRVTDAFMEAVRDGTSWVLRNRTDGGAKEVDARWLFNQISRTAHACGDPGLQFHDATNRWNTCLPDGEIEASNPCAEFVFLPSSACNLASLNLRKFQQADGDLDYSAFTYAVEIMITAQDILIERSSYPTSKIRANSVVYRPLGLGYSNLGAFLMARGLPYDSIAARDYAAYITSLMTGAAYAMSAELAAKHGAFDAYTRVKERMASVIDMHVAELDGRDGGHWEVAAARWSEARRLGEETGYRNAQVTLLAPTGTISFMMDCDTTGIEPDVALVKRKKLVGGGSITYENASITPALLALGYDPSVNGILKYVREKGTAVGAPGLREEHVPVFDCAFVDAAGRSISWNGHLQMLGAVQPWLSGAISKTVNLPASASVEDVKKVYLTAWELGLKSITIYRDGSKGVQPLESGGEGAKEKAPPPELASTEVRGRVKMPPTRESVSHKIKIAGHEGYVTAGMYSDGRLGELFVLMSKQGSTVDGLLGAWATAVSMGLQYGVPYTVFRDKFTRTRFEPSGYSELGHVTSFLDYIFKWIEREFPGGIRARDPQLRAGDARAFDAAPPPVTYDGPPCTDCGSITEPSGACYRCPVCGSSTGCG